MRAAHLKRGFESYSRWWGQTWEPSTGAEEIAADPVVRGSLTHVVDTLRPTVVRSSLPHVVDTLHQVAQTGKTEGRVAVQLALQL